jgi:glycosyltransferase involved in cell wall biosynthesis
MKILVFAHRLEVGGTQVNAMDLTAALRDRYGHEVVLFATPGPSLKLAEEKRLRFIPAPDATVHPSLARMIAIRNAVRRERPDIVHVWDWFQCLDAYCPVLLLQRTPMVVTDMSMAICRFLPKRLPMTFGTPELVEKARNDGRGPVEVIVPPVDCSYNAPGVVDPEAFRRQYGIKKNELTLVTVSRLVDLLKAESIRRTIEAVRILGREIQLRFIIVGDGTSRAEIDRLAREANSHLGREAILLTGALIDPRPAYAAADVVVGMGGSALRGMAFGKPVIVVGEKGYADTLTPDTADSFYYRGIFGLGDGTTDNSVLLASIQRFAKYPELTGDLGAFSRSFVLRYFDLDAVSARLNAFLEASVGSMPSLPVALWDGMRSGAILMATTVLPDGLRQRLRRRRAAKGSVGR